MKNYKVGDKVVFTANDFDGCMRAVCEITKVGEGFAIAEEKTQMNFPMKLYIDADTDYQFSFI